MDKKIRITPLKTQIKSVIIFIVAVVLFLVCINLLDLDIEKFLKRLKNAGNENNIETPVHTLDAPMSSDSFGK